MIWYYHTTKCTTTLCSTSTTNTTYTTVVLLLYYFSYYNHRYGLLSVLSFVSACLVNTGRLRFRNARHGCPKDVSYVSYELHYTKQYRMIVPRFIEPSTFYTLSIYVPKVCRGLMKINQRIIIVHQLLLVKQFGIRMVAAAPRSHCQQKEQHLLPTPKTPHKRQSIPAQLYYNRFSGW